MEKEFTPRQLKMLQQIYYLSYELDKNGLSIDDYDLLEKLKDKCKSFLPIF